MSVKAKARLKFGSKVQDQKATNNWVEVEIYGMDFAEINWWYSRIEGCTVVGSDCIL